MRWIQRGRQLGVAVKSAQRLRQIISVFGKHGFVDAVERMNLGKFLPSRLAAYAEAQADLTPQERLRMAFEELGPSFIKLGQLLSIRSDLLPEAFIEEFTKLQDQVQALPYDVIKSVIEKELNTKVENIFSFLDKTPLAAASIAQVHEGRLRSGETIVVKVQRPEIDKVIKTDISLLTFLANLLERYVPEVRIISPSTIVDEFFRTLSYELDFIVEANNMGKMAENMKNLHDIVIPRVYKQYSTRRVLTLEKIDGIPVKDLKALESAGVDRKRVVEVGTRAFFKSMMLDGLFHGDLHGGNLFVLPGNRIGLIDFGIVGRLSQKSRDQLANMMTALVTEDYEHLCFQYAELGFAGPAIDFDAFQREVRNTLSPYMGLTLAEVNIGKLLIETTKAATKYQIKVSGDWMLVFKALLTMEGLGRMLDPHFDMMALSQDLVKDLVKSQYSLQRITKEVTWAAKDLIAILQVLPRQLRWMFRKFNRNDFAFEIKSPELNEIRSQLDINGRRLNLCILIVGCFIASSIALQYPSGNRMGDYPLVSVVYFIGGVLLLVGWIVKSINK